MVQSIQGRDRAATGRATHGLAAERCNNVERVEESVGKKQKGKRPQSTAKRESARLLHPEMQERLSPWKLKEEHTT
jgi:hypothetical protein